MTVTLRMQPLIGSARLRRLATDKSMHPGKLWLGLAVLLALETTASAQTRWAT